MNALKLWCKAHSVYSEANKAESLFEGLTGRMKANGWTLIYYGDGGPGDQKLGVLGLSEYTKELRAFSCSSPVKVIGLRNTLSQADKLDALAHEIGHIECGHDLGSLTDRDEAEAERFARVLCARRPRHVVRWSAVIIAALCLSFGAGVLFANRSVDNPSDLPSAAPEVEYEPGQEIAVLFPDLDVATSGTSDDDALLSARELLGCAIYGLEEDGEDIPSPTPLSDIKAAENERVVLIDVYMPSIRQAHINRSVNRTVTLPAWLNAAALERNINFSQVLQDALKDQLHIRQ